MKKHPILTSMGIALLCGILIAVVFAFDISLGNSASVWEILGKMAGLLWSVLFLGALLGAFIVFPAILTLVNIIGIFVVSKREEERRVVRRFELLTIVLGALYTMLFFTISDIQIHAHWSMQLYNGQVHQPLWTEGTPTVIVLCVVGLVGYLALSGFKLKNMPPLVTVLAMSGMYIGLGVCILWMVHTVSARYWVLSVFPFNCFLIAFKTVRYKIREWNQVNSENDNMQGVSQQDNAYPDNFILSKLNRILRIAELWPVLALVLMWPLLGILLGILILFGQKPDAVIKAFTETADWRLSQQIAPQNAMYDEHYLCTVAAGGHERIVKPLRMGQRHGHRVVVNRQLCIANAFEQILEERVPGFHRAVRHFYDTYGFPLSRVIRTRGAADVVYILMKPLEWIFLCFIYLCDVKPENRIAVQYLPFTKVKE